MLCEGTTTHAQRSPLRMAVPNRLRYLDTVMPANVSTRFSTAANIEELLPEADLVIGAVLIAGARAPTLIQKRHLKTMKPGSVLVDVAVDQGGCIEVISA